MEIILPKEIAERITQGISKKIALESAPYASVTRQIMARRALKERGEDHMTELEKLAQYLKDHGYNFVTSSIPYFDKDGTLITHERNQIIVFKKAQYEDTRHRLRAKRNEITVGNVIAADTEISWDAICYRGTYGFEEGLLEVMGTDITSNHRSVEGWLTADDIIQRLEKKRRSEKVNVRIDEA